MCVCVFFLHFFFVCFVFVFELLLSMMRGSVVLHVVLRDLLRSVDSYCKNKLQCYCRRFCNKRECNVFAVTYIFSTLTQSGKSPRLNDLALNFYDILQAQEPPSISYTILTHSLKPAVKNAAFN